MPCYNPAEGWELALATNFAAFQALIADLGITAALIVVNDGSPRNVTPAHLARLSALVPGVCAVVYADNRGKGYALRQGVAVSEADFHLVTDADFPYTLPSMRRVVETLRSTGGVAAGNRDTLYYEKVPFFRKMLSQSLRWMLRNVLRLPITDSQCGLKGFDDAGKTIFMETTIDRFLFDLEFLMRTHGRVGVTAVPVELREGVVFSAVGWRVLAVEGRNFLRLFLVNLLKK